MIRDTDNIPYRKTAEYKRAKAAADAQKAAVRHRVGQLWPSESGQSTSGMVRRPRYGFSFG